MYLTILSTHAQGTSQPSTIFLFPQGVELAVESSTKASADVGLTLSHPALHRPLAATEDLHHRGLRRPGGLPSLGAT